MTTKLQKLTALGQSAWLDYIHRSLMASGELQALIDEGLRGITSNPTIFEKAIAGTTDYDGDIERLAREGKSVKEIYETLAMGDITKGADLLRPVYEATKGDDGYISLEANPDLANDTQGTMAEVRRLFAAVNRPNVMIKVPATEAGIPAIEKLIAEGININITLIFSLPHYEKVAEAYLRGLEQRAGRGDDLRRVASVASLFVSRVDTMVDPLLEKDGAEDLQGKIALANAKVVYARFLRIFATKRWQRLSGLGARIQRPLWGSTSTKNPRYPDTLYVDNLIGPNTVNTIPPNTMKAFRDHGKAARTIGKGLKEARADLARLRALGIDLDEVCRKLQDDGVAAFRKSFDELMASIAEKKKKLGQSVPPRPGGLGRYQAGLAGAFTEAKENRVVARIWGHDHTLWKPDPQEITNRLGWLDTAKKMTDRLGELHAFAEEIRSQGYTKALLLGMGGSSLAPGVFRQTFGVKEGCPDLSVLDSTVPEEVLSAADRLDLGRTFFIVSSKSGTTAETLSLCKYFFSREAGTFGIPGAGRHFIAVTDPDSPLENTAGTCWEFRKIFHGDPDIGGRYSALSRFGLVPAAIIGLDLERLLGRAVAMMRRCSAEEDNEAARLGIVMGEMANAGRDKLTLFTSPAVASFGAWTEQLIAESTGKEGRGILPVVGEPPGPPDVYGNDRLFVSLSLAGDDAAEPALRALENAGHPVVRLRLSDIYDIGGQFFLWEFATAVAGWRLKINPFDQPNVESAKAIARRFIAEYREKGRLPADAPAVSDGDLAVYGGLQAATPEEALNKFVGGAKPGDYIALQAYIQQTGETDALFLKLRTMLRDRSRTATTVGYGPRFLHSTGQLHKGDAGRGLFLQFTAEDVRDASVPEDNLAPGVITFSVLKTAQALGDRKALESAGRRVIRVDLGRDIPGSLRRIIATVK